ncbi:MULTISPECIES: CotH kinase family protein [Aeromicrobium]|uniref:CotH kinase family protein n=1 Tax=Aeromicrobium TaxID=2040 RepID=UPI00257E1E22|nr:MULTISPECIES: CotH kinase family protein [Aeromicrobium]
MSRTRMTAVALAALLALALLALVIVVNVRAAPEATAPEAAEETREQPQVDVERVATVRLTVPTDDFATEPAAPCSDLVTSATDPQSVELAVTASEGEQQELDAEVRVSATANPFNGLKRPYTVELADPASVLGLPASRDWMLLDEFADRSLLRTASAMEIARRLGIDWVPRLVPANLEINGTPCGLYSFGEVPTAQEGRAELADDDVLLLADARDLEGPRFSTERGLRVHVADPEEADPQEVAAGFQAVEDLLYDPAFPDNGYRDRIDVDSFVDWYLLNEVTKNLGSPLYDDVYFVLRGDGTLAMGPPWDFSASQGNRRNGSWRLDHPKGWWLQRSWYAISDDPAWRRAFSPTQVWNEPQGHYFNVLMSDPDFAGRVAQRWTEVSEDLSTIGDFVDERAAVIADDAVDNFSPPEVDGPGLPVAASALDNDPEVYVFANSDPAVDVGQGWRNEVDLLRRWLERRVAWLDGEFAEQAPSDR